VTAPSRAIVRARSEHGHARAVTGLSAVDGDEQDPAVGQLADAGARVPHCEAACIEVLAGMKHRLPALDERRPPPIAVVTVAQSDGRMSRTVTFCPAGASSCSAGRAAALAPTDVRTAPSGGIGVPPPEA
jgi:hypothetical protein